jgi:hypothetical protein
MKRRFPNVFYNLTTLAGTALAMIALGIIFLLYLLDTLSGGKHPYMGLITFIALPAVLIFGLLVALFGILRAQQRARHGTELPPLPHLDLNNPKHRRVAMIFSFGGVMFLVRTSTPTRCSFAV